ncbi:hypothetical protein C0J52_24425 [Blattella germanica]|nr:hypothetical protein C0J52_24425 [Blattella germanica]
MSSSFPLQKRKDVEKKQNIIKRLKLQGKEHENHVGKHVEKKLLEMIAGKQCKRHRCFETVSGEDRDALFQNFYTLESKDLQDSYLAGMITIQDVKQRRSRKQNVNPSTSESTTFAHQGSLFYKVRVTKDAHRGISCKKLAKIIF